MRQEIGYAQSQGGREYQEDVFAVVTSECVTINGVARTRRCESMSQWRTLLVLADGMGGMGHGDVAAKLIVEEFIETYLAYTGGPDSERTILNTCMHAANQKIAKAVSGNREYDGMGATLIGVSCDLENRLFEWVSVGDSLLLLERRGRLQLLNQLHSHREWMRLIFESDAREGKEVDWSRLDRLRDPEGLVSAVNGDAIEWYDLPPLGIDVEPGDILILASDGLETLTNDEIRSLISRHLGESVEAPSRSGGVASDIAYGLVASVASKNRMGQDNTSVLVSHFTPESEMSQLVRSVARPVSVVQSLGGRRAKAALLAVALLTFLSCAAFLLLELYKTPIGISPGHKGEGHVVVGGGN